MAEPIIDPKWHQDRNFLLRRFLVAGVMMFLVILAFILSFFKGCGTLGSVGKQNIYSPAQENKGFVLKANQLLEILLADIDTTSGLRAVNLETLNKKYRALVFDLPYASDTISCIEGGDLRLVGIRNDRIPEEWKQFYYNSRLPQLLQQQSDNLSETYFKIRLVSKGSGMSNKMQIKSVQLIPNMFKVALAKDPWTGIIYANDNCLFNDSNSVYVTYGNTVLPIHRNGETVMSNPLRLTAVNGELRIKNQKQNRDFDYYSYYLETYKSDRSVSITFPDSVKSINLCCSGNNLVISSQYNFNYGKKKEHAGDNVKVPIKDGEKLIFFDNSNRKLAELTVNTSNPTKILSSLIRTNMGSSRYTVARSQTDLFTQQLLLGLSRNLSNHDNVNNVNITLDPLLSKEFEDELIDYMRVVENVKYPKKQTNVEYDISLTIMDMATGNVIASPFYMSRFRKELKSDALQLITKNVSLRRRYLGSTFKPMLALAAAQTNPQLLNLNTKGMYSAVCNKNDSKELANFLGHHTKTWGKAAPWHWGGTDFVNFLAHSDDVYPVALAALAMTEQRGNYNALSVSKQSLFYADGKNVLNFRPKEWHNDKPFIHWLSMLYVANYNEEDSTDLHLFDGLFPDGKREANSDERQFGLEEVSPDIVNLHTDDFYKEGPFTQKLVPFVLGQGNNEWNCISIAEAWSRMIGRHDTRAHFIRTKNTNRLIANGSEENRPSIYGNQSVKKVQETWNSFLLKFEDAQHLDKSKKSTLSRMYNAVSVLNKDKNTDLVLFSKTGTPDAYVRNEFPLLTARKRFMDLGLYTFTLVKRSELQKIKNNQSGKGIVCVVRVARHYTCKDCTINTPCDTCKAAKGLDSSVARDFFAENQYRLRKLYDMTKNYY